MFSLDSLTLVRCGLNYQPKAMLVQRQKLSNVESSHYFLICPLFIKFKKYLIYISKVRSPGLLNKKGFTGIFIAKVHIPIYA